MAILTREQIDFVRASPQVSLQLDDAHREVIKMMTDETLRLQEFAYVQQRDFAIASIAAIEEEIQRRWRCGGRNNTT